MCNGCGKEHTDDVDMVIMTLSRRDAKLDCVGERQPS